MEQTRIDRLLEIVNENKKIEVSKLANLLAVSKVTIRKDLNELEERGLLKREHGFAIVNNPDDLNYRLAQNYQTKLKIASEASRLVKEQETIMIESGSTCALLAEQLGKQGKHVTIITISYFIANYVAQYPNLSVIILGGQYQSTSQVVVGPLVKRTLQGFKVQKLFIGTDGFDDKMGFFGNDLMRTETVRQMAQDAKELIILTDSSKFQKPSLIQQFSLTEVSEVITDRELSDTAKKTLAAKKIIVKLV
ncbi:DeoR/GlpR family DNA-binding transcription regulator [Xylocopilactobacillus apicola]|uniref:Lactose phosphotransferase system repressor n=1 Tax=Xylocopilactobacillus apicola TaxID=2932184 RepID=A0AAU9DPR3_9LACO|nr:DeoR/GlpR family DNA-binding transcription regulator [Xylocopilactobacillus apicola]BDR59172.1 DeoR family transcriptional regulator [Xylocopilactobacillus apicola]